MADKTGKEICRICDGGPGNNGMCLCGEQAYYTPTPGDLSARLLVLQTDMWNPYEMLRVARLLIPKMADIGDQLAVERIDECIRQEPALSALPAAGGEDREWMDRWSTRQPVAGDGWIDPSVRLPSKLDGPKRNPTKITVRVKRANGTEHDTGYFIGGGFDDDDIFGMKVVGWKPAAPAATPTDS